MKKSDVFKENEFEENEFKEKQKNRKIPTNFNKIVKLRKLTRFFLTLQICC